MSHDRLDWERMLAARGHRITTQRALVLDAICSAESHSITLADIHAYVRRRDRRVDRSTIYRALHLFEQLGIVVSSPPDDGEARYEIMPPSPHHHLVCRQCGREAEVESAEILEAFAAIEARFGFLVTTGHLTLHGLCAACRAGSADP